MKFYVVKRKNENLYLHKEYLYKKEWVPFESEEISTFRISGKATDRFSLWKTIVNIKNSILYAITSSLCNNTDLYAGLNPLQQKIVLTAERKMGCSIRYLLNKHVSKGNYNQIHQDIYRLFDKIDNFMIFCTLEMLEIIEIDIKSVSPSKSILSCKVKDTQDVIIKRCKKPYERFINAQGPVDPESFR